MTDNRFIDKFKHKTDADLVQIVTNKQDYNEDAIAAALFILDERKSTVIDIKTETAIIEKEKERKALVQAKHLEEDKNRLYHTDDPNAPQLHSKAVIRLFSGMFSTIFGGVLLMYNMKQIGNTRARNEVLLFTIGYTMATLVLVNTIPVVTKFVIAINFVGGGILSEYFWNKYIGEDFKYRKRSWVKPALVAIAITSLLVIGILYGG